MCWGKGRGKCHPHDVVHEIRAAGAGVSEPHRLHRGRSEGEDFGATPLGVPVQIDEDVDPVAVDAVSGVARAGDAAEVHKVLRLPADLLVVTAAIRGVERVTEDLHKVPAVKRGNVLHQMRRWVVFEVRPEDGG